MEGITEETYDVQMISLSAITENQFNPRKTFTDMEELTADVKKRGILQPVLVRPIQNGDLRYELVFGARRYRAAKAAGLSTVPAMVRPLPDDEALELMIVENCKRADIHPLEEAEGYRQLHERHGHDVDDIAAKVGKSRAFVYARMKLCALTKPARKTFLDGKLSPSVALLVARMPAELQVEATKQVTHRYGRELEVPMSYREASELLQREYMLRLHDAPFPKADAELVPAAGACTTCPKRTGNQRELFEDVKNADVCTDPKCFRSKLDAFWNRITETATESGYRILGDKEIEKVFPPAWKSGGMAHGTDYVDLDEDCYHVAFDSKSYGKKYGQILKESLKSGDVVITLARDQVGRIRKLVQEKEALAALRKLGLTKSTTLSSSRVYSAKERAAAKRAKMLKAIAREASGRMVETVAKGKIQRPAVERLLAVLVAGAVHMTPGERILKARKLPKVSGWDQSGKKLVSILSKKDEAECRGLALELLLEDRLEYMHGSSSTYPWAMTEAARVLGVDLKALEKEALAAEVSKKNAAKAKKRTGKK